MIRRLEVETYFGKNLVIATLTGATTGSNQCLFSGYSHKDANVFEDQFLRRPMAVLRKGELFAGQTSRLKSISLPTGNLTAAGAGSTGMSTAIKRSGGSVAASNIVVTLEFENGVRQIMKGTP